MSNKNHILTMILALATGFSVQAQGLGMQAQGLGITQISTERLLFSQETRLYLSAPALARNLDNPEDALEIWESGDGKNYSRRPVSAVSARPHDELGISFFLLLDNSGSMWTDIHGNDTQIASELRVEQAKAAARDFLGALSPLDRAALAVFNTRYWHASPSGSAPEDIARALDELRRPATEDAYTELYLSINRAMADFSAEAGRRVLIVLSDGENYPYAQLTGKPNPQSGTASATPAELIDNAIRNGISVYAIRYGAQKDPLIGSIAGQSGGRAFDAMDLEGLSSIYDTIRRDVLNELAVDYKASMDAGEKRWVRVTLRDSAGARYSAERYYYSGTLFGQGAGAPKAWYFLLPLLAALAWLLLALFKLERDTDRTGIRLLFGARNQNTRFFALSGPQTIIGAAPNADISIAGNPSLRASHATVLFDEQKNIYTVVSDSPITVNNQSVSKKRLESGDVINMSGTVVVFDEALAKPAKATKPDKAAKPATPAKANKPARPKPRN
jgi:Ca-activated chloride channel family protein